MSREYNILKTTNHSHTAIESRSLEKVEAVLTELRDDMREYDLNNKSHQEALDDINRILEKIQIARSTREETEIELISEISSEIMLLSYQIDNLYLREIDNDQNPPEAN